MKQQLVLFTAVLVLTTSSCRSDPEQSSFLDEIAGAFSSGELFLVSPETVPEALADFARLDSPEPGEYEWTFDGEGIHSGIEWAQARFQPGEEEGGWALLHVQLALSRHGPDGQPVLQSLHDAVKDRLGPPAWGRQDGPEGMTGWNVGGFNEVLLQWGEIPNPVSDEYGDVVLIQAVVNQGEADY